MGQSPSKRSIELLGQRTVPDFNSSFRESVRRPSRRQMMKWRDHFNEDQEIFQKPMCLISTEGGLHIEEDTLEQIQQIKLPVVVIAVVGLYRTGKSYLMNRLAGQSKGFTLGNSVQSETKGIWVWCRRHPQIEGAVLVLLDTEGLGDVAKGCIAHDNQIFTLAVLLCNVMVYNIMNAFNQDAVEKLTFVSEISKHIKFKNKNDEDSHGDESLELILPTFVLCIRDFGLQLKSKDGRECTAKEYLEECLHTESRDAVNNENYTRPRESIKKYFPKRMCFTFDRPGDRHVLANLEELELSDLSKTFNEDVNVFLNHMYTCRPKQLLGSKPVTGEIFGQLTKFYVNAIRNGQVPDVDNAFEAVANKQNEKLEKEAVERVTKRLQEITLPVPRTDELDSFCMKLVNETLEDFRSKAVFYTRKFEDRVMGAMGSMLAEMKKNNEVLVTDFCRKELDASFNEVLEKKLQEKKYHKAGGYASYKKDREKAEKKFIEKVQGIDEFIIKRVLCTLLDEQRKIENEIIEIDKRMNEEEKENERQRMQKEMETALEKQRELFDSKQACYEQRVQDQIKHNEELRKAYEEREKAKTKELKDEIESLKKDHNQTMEAVIKKCEERQEKAANTFKEELKELRQRFEKEEQDLKNKVENLQKEQNKREEKKKKYFTFRIRKLMA